MSHYSCKSCDIPVAGKSTAVDVCAGDYPWWNCCNCASSKSGWAGWDRRACPQCRQRDVKVGWRVARACAFMQMLWWWSYAPARASALSRGASARRCAHCPAPREPSLPPAPSPSPEPPPHPSPSLSLPLSRALGQSGNAAESAGRQNATELEKRKATEALQVRLLSCQPLAVLPLPTLTLNPKP